MKSSQQLMFLNHWSFVFPNNIFVLEYRRYADHIIERGEQQQQETLVRPGHVIVPYVQDGDLSINEQLLFLPEKKNEKGDAPPAVVYGKVDQQLSHRLHKAQIL